jgi:hypothetical protein
MEEEVVCRKKENTEKEFEYKENTTWWVTVIMDFFVLIHRRYGTLWYPEYIDNGTVSDNAYLGETENKDRHDKVRTNEG